MNKIYAANASMLNVKKKIKKKLTQHLMKAKLIELKK